MRRRTLTGLLTAASLGLLGALPSAAGAQAQNPPFTQCPAVGADASCQFLVTITDTGRTISVDPSQGPFDGIEDSLIGVQNNSSKPLPSVSLSESGGNTSGEPLFNFEGDGLCTQTPSPSGCPFGPTGYEGPGTSFAFDPAQPSHGTINFSPAIPPGGKAYFSLESPPAGGLAIGNPATIASTVLAGGGKTGQQLNVSTGTTVTDTATLAGPSAAGATGVLNYAVYSDPACKTLVANAGTVNVAGPTVPPSNAAKLPAGKYYWQATYSGDNNNTPAQSPCGSEVLTVAAAPAVVPLGQIVKAPKNKRCLSKRKFKIRLRIPNGVTPVAASVVVNKRKAVVIQGSRLTSAITLAGLPKGRYTVTIAVQLSDGRILVGKRRYHTCTKKRRHRHTRGL